MEHDARRPEPSGTALWPIATLVTTFVVSRVLAIKCGTSFDVSTIGTFMQFLDPQLLLRDPLRSVWLLHSQPPLFNLYLALGLAFGPDGALPFFAATYLGAGLLLALGLWGLLRAVGLRAWTASVLASVFVASPTSLLL